MSASRATDRSRGGFTLVEMLVALSVLTLLVTMFVTIFQHTSRAWLGGEGNSERRRGARALTDYIVGELGGAVLPVEKISTTARGNLQFVINPPVAQVPEAYRYADAVFWQAPLATEASFGDLAEIGYFVKWAEVSPGDWRPQLCRFFVNPSTTDAAGQTIANPNHLIFATDPKAWLSTSLIEAVAPATKSSSYAGLFAENVLGLWVRGFGLDGTMLPRSFDSRVGYNCKFETTDASGFKQTWDQQRYLPARVRISIAEIDAHHAARLGPIVNELQAITQLASIESATDFLEEARKQAATSAAWRSILPGLRIYSAEVFLQNAR